MKLAGTAHRVVNGYTMQITYLLVIFAVVVQHSFAEKFPEFIDKCKLSDPKFDDCVLNSTKNCMNTVFKGDARYGIAPIADFSNTTKTYNVSANFHFKFINQTTNYYKNFVVTNIHFDFDKKLLTFETKSPQTEYFGRYEAAGEILGKPVHESGTANVTFDYIELNAEVTLDFKMKDGKKYLQAVTCTLVVNIKNFQFNPQDQVSGGEPMTAEQKKVYQSYIEKLPEMLKRDNEKFNVGVVKTLNSVFDLLPFEELFIP